MPTIQFLSICPRLHEVGIYMRIDVLNGWCVPSDDLYLREVIKRSLALPGNNKNYQ